MLYFHLPYLTTQIGFFLPSTPVISFLRKRSLHAFYMETFSVLQVFIGGIHWSQV